MRDIEAMFSATHQAAKVAGASCHQHSGAREGLHYRQWLTGGGHGLCSHTWWHLHFQRVQWQVPSMGVHFAAHITQGLPTLTSAPRALLPHKRHISCCEKHIMLNTLRVYLWGKNFTKATRDDQACEVESSRLRGSQGRVHLARKLGSFAESI